MPLPSRAEVARAHRLLADHLVGTPALSSETEPGAILKCENLQRTGSFKVRGALHALLSYRDRHPDVWDRMQREGVVTCSSGNFGQALAWATARLGLALSVVVPDDAPASKLERILRFNPATRVVAVGYPEWRRTMETSRHDATPGVFLSSELDDYVSEGIATIGHELLEQCPSVDAILVPYGGGNLAYSLAAFLRSAGSGVPVYAVEMATGAPFSASLRAGRPAEVEYERSFVDGIGATFVIPAQFARVRHLVAGALTVSPDEVAAAVSTLLFGERLLCEGAGAAPFAALLEHRDAFGWRAPCAVLTGGVIGREALVRSALASGRPRHISYQAA